VQALTERPRFVDATARLHLSRSLTFDSLPSAEVLDGALSGLKEKTRHVRHF
jgi:hypothetical protein